MSICVLSTLLAVILGVLGITVYKNGFRAVNEEIPIVMSTDDRYVYPTIVCMTSLLENSDKDKNYKIYILVPGDISEDNIKKLASLQAKYKNCHIETRKIGDNYDEYQSYRYFTKAIFFRLKIPSVLAQEKKCLYIDTDTIITGDLSELYETDISNYYIAGIPDGTGISYEKRLKESLNMSDNTIRNYINSGVLLWNLEKVRQDNIEEKFDEFVQKNVFETKRALFPDQDCINMVCEGKILSLPLKYNLGVQIKAHIEYENNRIAKACFSKEDWEEGINNPVIIHYTSNRKPWRCLKCPYIDLWWRYANGSDFANEIGEKYYRYKK